MHKITVKKKSVSNDNNLLIENIFEYFNNFRIELNEDDNYYYIELFNNNYMYCENISSGLKFLKVDTKDVNKFCRIEKNSAICLSENWLPYAYLYLKNKKGIKKQKITILHFDDHKDLMEPFISAYNNKYRNSFTGESFSFSNLKNIKDSILDGSITIGSMLTTIAYMENDIDIIHFKQNTDDLTLPFSKGVNTANHFGIRNRISINFKENKSKTNKYYRTSNLNSIYKNIDYNSACILHFDMDYFNNRYNASTEWVSNKYNHDPDIQIQIKKIDDIIEMLKHLKSMVNIEFVLIGISPSFYPVEFWEKGLTHLTNRLVELGFDTDLLLKND